MKKKNYAQNIQEQNAPTSLFSFRVELTEANLRMDNSLPLLQTEWADFPSILPKPS